MFICKEPSLIIRRLPSSEKIVYLTFDDGPDADLTPQILDLLQKYNIKATFFVIGDKVDKNYEIVKKIKDLKNSVYSHSKDHSYKYYFKSEKEIEKWVLNSINHLNNIVNEDLKCFRPPAGIVTPPLVNVCRKNQIPLLLWSQRVYDSTSTFKMKKVEKLLKNIKSGDIVLLHDFQKNKNKDIFIKSLEELIRGLIYNNYKLAAIDQYQINLS